MKIGNSGTFTAESPGLDHLPHNPCTLRQPLLRREKPRQCPTGAHSIHDIQMISCNVTCFNRCKVNSKMTMADPHKGLVAVRHQQRGYQITLTNVRFRSQAQMEL